MYLCLCVSVWVHVAMCAPLCVHRFMYMCGCDQALLEGVLWVYACEHTPRHVHGCGPLDTWRKWGWGRVWSRADHGCVTAGGMLGQGCL